MKDKNELIGRTLMCIDSMGRKREYGTIKKIIGEKTLKFEAGDHLPIPTMKKWIKKGKMWFKYS